MFEYLKAAWKIFNFNNVVIKQANNRSDLKLYLSFFEKKSQTSFVPVVLIRNY